MLQEVGGQFDGTGLEEGHGRRTSEGKVAFFVALLDGGSSLVSLVDGSDAGRSDLKDQDEAQVSGLQTGQHPLVFP